MPDPTLQSKIVSLLRNGNEMFVDENGMRQAHLPMTPEWKNSDEARAWAESTFGTSINRGDEVPEADRLAAINKISAELLRHKEAGTKMPSSVNIRGPEFFHEVMRRYAPRYAWYDPRRYVDKTPDGMAATPKGEADPAIWINTNAITNPAYPGWEGHAVTHEIAHTRDNVPYPEKQRALTETEAPIAGRLLEYSRTNRAEFIAETYTKVANGEPVDPAAMQMYERMGGPPIPRLLPRREAWRPPPLADRIVSFLRGGK